MFNKFNSFFSEKPEENIQNNKSEIVDLKNEYKTFLNNSHSIIGAVTGDIIGSVFEFNNTKQTDFNLFSKETDFTDDTVLTIAVADCILNNKPYGKTIKDYGRNFPGRGYGNSFRNWLSTDDLKPYNSWGNGSAMRVSSVGFAFNSMDEILKTAKETAEVTHNHFEGIKGAQATAAAIFLARTGNSKIQIKKYITEKFGYNLEKSINSIRSNFAFDESCAGTVPPAITAFLESSDYENAIRLAISIGGDSDTIACITGGIASAFYKKIPNDILTPVIDILPLEFLKLIIDFDKKFKT